MESLQKKRFCLVLLVSFVQIHLVKSVTSTDTYKGCYRINRSHERGMSPGGYKPGAMTPGLCQQLCAGWKWQYATVTEGRFCFCSDKLLSDANKVESSACSTPCYGDSTLTCGGDRHLEVYESSLGVVGLQLDSTAGDVIQVGDPVTFQASYDSGPGTVYFQLDPGDGSVSKVSTSSEWSVSYSMPGEYIVRLSAAADESLTQAVSNTRRLLVQSPVSDVSVMCPEVVLVGEEFQCEAKVQQASYASVSIRYGDGLEESFPIAGPWYQQVGSVLADPLVAGVTGELYLLPGSEIEYTGALTAFHFAVASTGNIILLVLEPVCSGGKTYCHTDQTCVSTATACQPHWVYTCSGSEQFCPRQHTCVLSSDTTCAITPRHSSGQISLNYKIKHEISYDSSDVGSHVHKLAVPLDVQAGDILGYFAEEGTLAAQTVVSGDGSLADAAFTGYPSGSVGPSDITSAGLRHFLSAVVARPARVLLFHKYQNSGEYDLNLEVSSDFLSSSSSADAHIVALEPINATVIEHAGHVTTGLSTTLTVSAHTGSPAEYTWLVENQLFLTLEPELSYTFPARGYYVINVTAANEVDSKTNVSVIGVEDTITNLTVTPAYQDLGDVVELTLKMGSGSDFWCDLDYKDGEYDSLDQYLDVMPAEGLKVSHTYSEFQDYNMEITCSNHVSNDTISVPLEIQQVVTGLELTSDPEYAKVGQSVTLQGSIATGTSVSLQWEISGETPIHLEGEFSATTGLPAQFNSFDSASNHMVTLYASNIHGTANATTSVHVQHPVTRDFTVTNDSPTKGEVSLTVSLADTQPLPTDAQIKWVFKDGSQPEVGSLSARTHSVTHDFLPGDYDVTVTIWNQVSSEIFSTKVSVYGDITDVSVSTTYRRTGSLQDLGGSGDAGDQFPLQYPVRFAFTTAGGPVTGYRLEATGPGSTDETYALEASESPVSYRFTQAGEYLVKCTAFNPLSEAAVNVSLILVAGISGLTLTDNNILTAPGQTKTLWLYLETFSDNSCVHVDVGDGSPVLVYGIDSSTCKGDLTSYEYRGKLSPETIINHLFPNEGTYMATAIGFESDEPDDQQMSLVEFPVTGIDCQKPDISIKDAVIDWEQAVGVYRKDRLKVTGVVTDLACVHTNLNIKSWMVEHLVGNGNVWKEVKLGSWASTTVQLEFPEKALSYGLHKITFIVTMDPSKFPDGVVFRSQAVTYINVLKSPPIARLVQGGITRVSVGQGQDFDLDPDKYSIFPDAIEVQARRRRRDTPEEFFDIYNWYCRQFAQAQVTDLESVYSSADKQVPQQELKALFDVDDGSACLKGQAGLTGYQGNKVVLDTSSFPDGSVFGYLAVLDSDGSTSAAAILVDVVENHVPLVHIDCPNSAVCQPTAVGLRVNSKENIALIGGCDDACAAADDVTYQWTLEVMTPSLDWIVLDGYMYGQTTQKIIIQHEAFSGSHSLQTVRVTLTITSGGEEGKAYVLLVPNPPPSGGDCSVVPPVDEPQINLWNVSCIDWHDDDGIVLYRLYALFDGETTEMQLAIGEEGHFQVGMPLGAEWDDFQFELFMRICDQFDACTVHEFGKIKLAPMPKSAIEEKLSSLLDDEENSQLHLVGVKGNVQETIQTCNFILELMNRDHREMQLEFGDLNVPVVNTATHYGPSGELPVNSSNEAGLSDEERHAKCESKRNVGAQRRSDIWSYVSVLPQSSPEDLAASLSTTRSLTTAVEELPRADLLSMADWTQSVGRRLVELAGNMAPSQTLELATNLLAVVGNIQEAITVGIDQQALDVDEQSVDAFYEVHWESEEERLVDFPTDVALVRLRVEDNRNEQKRATSEVVDIFDTTLKDVGEVLRGGMASGESRQISTRTLDLVLEAAPATDIADRSYSAGRTSFSLPVMDVLLPELKPDDTVFMMSIATPTNPYLFCRHGRFIPRRSSSLGVSLYQDDDEEIQVSDTRKPIILRMPRDPALTCPDPEDSGAPLQLPEGRLMVTRSGEIIQYNASLTVDILPDCAPQAGDTFYYLVVARLGDFPNITAGVWQFAQVITKNNETEKYKFFLSNIEINNWIGMVYVSVRQITQEEAEEYIAEGFKSLTKIRDPAVFTCGISMTIFSSCCLYFDARIKDMSAWGCNVTSETTCSETVCACNHLTSFASGWVVVPNTIDWDFVFSNADFLSNPTLYITQIVVAVIYLMAAIWARRQDKKDMLKIGLTPLMDNNPQDRCMYEILVNTGMRSGAATDSKVHVVFSGEREESEVRELTDDKRRLFRRGETNHFLMTTPRPLGALNYAQVWHDNSGKGKQASWYLNYVVVLDLQTQQRYTFICNRWLAVEEDDGQVSRVLPVAGPEQLLEFGHLFGQKTRRQLVDGHLWFSVLGRPPRSRFTRLQRVSCCLCLLFTSMLANAMFYEKDSSGAKPFTLGPFALSPQQIFIGVASNLIVFPVNLVIITLFRRSRPRKKRTSRIQEALNETKQKHASAPSSGQDPSAIARPVSSNSWVSTTDLHNLDQDMQRGNSGEMRNMSQAGQVKKRKKKQWSLPWWCMVLGWVLLWMVVATCVAFVTFYGIQFQDVKCKKWITSMLVSFFSSIFFTQPIKVLLLAIMFSLICKKAEDEEEEEEGVEDEEQMHLQWDEEWLHADPYNQGYSRPQRAAYRPPDPQALEKARMNRLQELRMYDIIREVTFYAIFLWVLMVASYGFRDPKAFELRTGIENILVSKGSANYSDFTKMGNIQNMWQWMKRTLVPGIRAGIWYNGRQPIGERGFMADRTSRIMGYATVRQLRAKTKDCGEPSEVTSLFTGCRSGYDMLQEEREDYGPAWIPLTPNKSCTPGYCYRSGEELDGLPYLGQRALYAGGGYLVELKGGVKTMLAQLDQLETELWLDRHTRALFIELTGYNAFVNLFAITTLLVELLPTGGLLMSYRVEAVNLLDSLTSGRLVYLVCQLIFVAFILFFLVKEIRKMRKEKRAYLRQFWNWVELVVIGLAITAVVIYIYRLVATWKLTDRFRETHGNEYMKFQGVGYWNELLTYIIGWLVFLATVKFLRLLRFNRRMAMLASTLRHGSRSMTAFAFMFVIFFFAFVQMYYLVFGSLLMEFATPVGTAESLLQVTLGDFDFHAMRAAQPQLAGILFFMYVCSTTFILLNMFVSILNDTFSVVRSDITKQGNDHEVIDFMVRRFKTWIGIGKKSADQTNKNLDDIQYIHFGGQPLGGAANPYELEPRLDEFFERIGGICFEGNPFNKKTLAAYAAEGGVKKGNWKGLTPRKPSIVLLDMERELGSNHI